MKAPVVTEPTTPPGSESQQPKGAHSGYEPNWQFYKDVHPFEPPPADDLPPKPNTGDQQSREGEDCGPRLNEKEKFRPMPKPSKWGEVRNGDTKLFGFAILLFVGILGFGFGQLYQKDSTRAAPVENLSTNTSSSAPTTPLDSGGTGRTTEVQTTETTAPTQRGVSPQALELTFIKACKDSAKKQIMDPDSAQFGDDWEASPNSLTTNLPSGYDPANGHRRYGGGGTVNAKNAFGGYTGYQRVMCDGYINPRGGTAKARAYLGLEDQLGLILEGNLRPLAPR